MVDIKSWWHKISDLGIGGSQTRSLAGSIRLTNQVAVVGGLLSFFYLSAELLFANYALPASQTALLYGVQAAQILLFTLVLVLNFYEKNLAARVLFCLLLPFAFLPNSYILNQPLRAEFYMFGFAAAAFLLFGQQKLITMLFVVPILVFYLMVVNLHNHFPSIYHLNFGTLVRIAISFVSLYAIMSLLRRENNRYADELKDLNELKNKIFSIVSHDLRGPIGSLHALLQMMENSQLSQEEFQHLIKSLHINVKQLHGTLDNLLQWSYAQSDGLKAMPQPFLMTKLVEEIFQLLKFNAESKGVSLQKHGALQVEAFADLTMVRSVLINLISNALKFTPHGGKINVTAALNQKMVHVTVQDNGRGMPTEMVKSLFKTAQHFSTPGTNEEKGTGLGLLLCREFVEKNGGAISVSSELNKGSKFSFTLPLAKTSNQLF